MKKIKSFCLSVLVFSLILTLNGRIFAKQAEEAPASVNIKLSFAGDCTLGMDHTRGYANSFYNVFDKQKGNFAYFFENVKPIFEADDLTIVNLEGPLTDKNTSAKKEFTFKGLPSFTNILKEGSVEAVNFANNHNMDYKQGGFDDTLKHLSEAGIGVFVSPKEYITEVKGIKVGFLGYKGWSAGAKNEIKADIQALKDKGARLVTVSFHWGIERANVPNKTQTDLGHWAIDSGADLVVGHHPHVMQGIEKYKDKYIVYSLGNFCFGGNRNPTDKDTFIFTQQFTFDYKEGTYNLTKDEVKIHPVMVSSVKNLNDFKPTPAQGADFERIAKRLNDYSAKVNKEKIYLPIVSFSDENKINS